MRTVLAASVKKLPKHLSGKDEDTANTEGITDRDKDRIVGGNFADRGEYPWLIVLRYNGGFICGGTILNKDTILTAAHCVEEDPNQWFGDYSIKAGDYQTFKKESTEQIVRVQRVRVHNMYDKLADTDRDIAILKLKESLTFNDYVKAIPLASKSQEKTLVKLNKCVVAGIGDTQNWDSTPNKAKEAAVTMKGKSTCSKLAKKYKAKFTNYMVCSLDEGEGACSGDSGGPLMCFDRQRKAYQVGIVSYGSEDCWDGFNVYARVSALRKWIKKYL
ncbi:chymotrypsin-1-like [Mercenaria mercenaria]|uniref:chymotrypsin-1-like n=1 Tax=Mercenaria mercenaria TaxID=6596 RepID=UPI00234F223C|nr:chymotrypsin-1-like [Mercenaria mercenaria]